MLSFRNLFVRVEVLVRNLLVYFLASSGFFYVRIVCVCIGREGDPGKFRPFR